MMLENTSIFYKLKLILTGLLALPIIGTYLVLTIPIYIYRWVIVYIMAPFYRPDIGNIISGLGVPLALEFYQSNKKLDQSAPFQFKSNIVVKLVAEGRIPFDELIDAFQERVLNKLDMTECGLLYPELQQHPSAWMGFMFWKRDKDFNLSDHFHSHKTNEMWDSSRTFEGYVSGMMEELVNKQFPPNRSPWDMHVIHINNNQELPDTTVLMFCVHHSIGDGFSLINLIVKDYFNTPDSNLQLVSPSPLSKLTPQSESPHQTSIRHVWDITLAGLIFLIQMLSDLGYVLSRRRFREMTPWHVNPDAKLKRPLLTSRSKAIPIRVVKDVKDKFGVTFASVLLSIFIKGISESFRKAKSKPNTFKILVVQPLPNHPKELRNHATALYLEICPNPELYPKERLHLVDSSLREQKKNFVMRPVIASFFVNMFSFQLAYIANIIIGRNLTFATFFSNFPIPVMDFAFNGRKILETDFTAGTLQGVSGVAFLVSSYDGSIRLGATAESGVMTREELDELIQVITDELYELCQQSL